MKTTTEFIQDLLNFYPKHDWDRIPGMALMWNKTAHNLPDETVLSMYESLKSLKLFTEPSPSWPGDDPSTDRAAVWRKYIYG